MWSLRVTQFSTHGQQTDRAQIGWESASSLHVQGYFVIVASNKDFFLQHAYLRMLTLRPSELRGCVPCGSFAMLTKESGHEGRFLDGIVPEWNAHLEVLNS